MFGAARPEPGAASRGSADGDQRKSSCGFSIAWHKAVASAACVADSNSIQNEYSGELDWVTRAPGLCEVTIGATGLRQGAKVDGVSSARPVIESMQSSLCKRQMLNCLAETVQIKLSDSLGAGDERSGAENVDAFLTQATGLTCAERADCPSWMSAYDKVKRCAKSYHHASMLFRDAAPFRGWLRGQCADSSVAHGAVDSACCPRELAP